MIGAGPSTQAAPPPARAACLGGPSLASRTAASSWAPPQKHPCAQAGHLLRTRNKDITWEGQTSGHSGQRQPRGPPGSPVRSKRSHTADTLQQGPNLHPAGRTWGRDTQNTAQAGTGSLVWVEMEAWAGGGGRRGQAGPAGALQAWHTRVLGGTWWALMWGGKRRAPPLRLHTSCVFCFLTCEEMLIFKLVPGGAGVAQSARSTSGLGLGTFPATRASFASRHRAEKCFRRRKNMTWYLLDETSTLKGKFEIWN